MGSAANAQHVVSQRQEDLQLINSSGDVVNQPILLGPIFWFFSLVVGCNVSDVGLDGLTSSIALSRLR